MDFIHHMPLPKSSIRKMVLLLSAVILSAASISSATVSVEVRMSDGNTPFPPIEPNLPYMIYPDIMVGTKLTIIIDSNLPEYWENGGALAVAEVEMVDYGLIYGRGYNGFEYPNSCLPDSGIFATVYDSYTYPGPGFDIYGGEEPNAGDWFIFDYNALDIGDCDIKFYHNVFEPNLICTLVFHHVRTRDFNGDTTVDFLDYAMLASHWQVTDCNEPDWCQGTDLDTDGNIDMNDLMEFCKFWLKKTE